MKKLLLLVLCLVLAMSMCLTACDNGNGDDTPGNGETCEHVGTVICEKCYANLYTSTTPTIPDVSSIGAKVTNLALTITETEAVTNVEMEMIEGYVALGDDGKLDGYGVVEISLTRGTGTGSVVAHAYIEDNVIYFYGDAVADSDRSVVTYTVSVEEITEMRQIKDALAAAEEYLPTVEAWLENSLLPVFEDVKVDESVSDAVAKKTAKLINSFYVANKASDGSTTLTLSLDVLKSWNESFGKKSVAEFIDLIADEGTYAELKALIEGDKLYNYSVADLIDYLKTEQGINPTELLAALDALAVEITGDKNATFEMLLLPNGDVDLDDFLNDPEILALSVKDALVAAGVGETPEAAVAAVKEYMASMFTLLEENSIYGLIILNNSSEQPSEADIQETIDDIDGYIDMVSSYFTYTMKADKNNNVTEANLTVNVSVENSSVVVTAKATSSKLEVTAAVTTSENETANIGITATTEKVTLTYDINISTANCDCTVEIIPGYTVTPDAEVLASIKSTLATAAQSITATALENHLKSNYSYVLEDDTYIYVFEYYYISDGIVYADVVAYDVTDYFGYGVVGDGAVDVIFNATRSDSLELTTSCLTSVSALSELYWNSNPENYSNSVTLK